MVKFYQVSLGYFIGGNCRYYPSCSHYAIESFENLPFTMALKLSLKRILKCHPFGPTALYDPVPQKIKHSS